MINKKALRQKLLSTRSQLDQATLAERNQSICHQIQMLEEFQKAQHVLMYYPIGNEVDLRLLFQNIPQKNWYLPKMTEEGSFIALPFQDESELSMGRYQIPEPRGGIKESKDDLIDLALVPGVGFDPSGNRLGMGKGYYDRYLSEASEVYKIGVAFAEQIVDTVPVEAHDILMDAIATDVELLKF